MMSSMKFRHEITYDAPPAEVTVERTGNAFTLTIDQVQRTDDLPGFARTFAGDSTRAITLRPEGSVGTAWPAGDR
jgi:hypothetical protein